MRCSAVVGSQYDSFLVRGLSVVALLGARQDHPSAVVHDQRRRALLGVQLRLIHVLLASVLLLINLDLVCFVRQRQIPPHRL